MRIWYKFKPACHAMHSEVRIIDQWIRLIKDSQSAIRIKYAFTMHSVTCFTHLQTFYTFPARCAARLSFPILASSTFSWLWWCNYFTLNFSQRKIFNGCSSENIYARDKNFISKKCCLLSRFTIEQRQSHFFETRMKIFRGWKSSGWFYYLLSSQYIFRYISAIFFPYASNEVTDCIRTFSVVLRGNFMFFSLRSMSSRSHDCQAYFCDTPLSNYRFACRARKHVRMEC